MKKEKDVKVVEKLEDINVMEGIDFKKKLSKLDKDIIELKKKAKKENRLEKTLLSICLVLAGIITIMLAIMIFKDDDKNINECISKGYTKQACEKSIIGY